MTPGFTAWPPTPTRWGAYCALLRVRDQWLSQRPGAEHSPEYREFSRNLMLLCEHTWGRDSKRWFSDYKNWSKEDFRAARKRDLVTAEDTLPAGELISQSAVQQPTFRRGDCRYFNLEASWQEQREYVNAAAAALPEPWRTEARHPLAALRPCAPRRAVVTYQFGSGIDMNLQWFGKDVSRI